jgi:NAD(P)H-dependent FMN reductase
MVEIQVILGTVREGRQGEKVANWVYQVASRDERIQAELLDLKDYPLPFYSERLPPSVLQGNYSSEVAKRWVAKIAPADGYIFVSPEYNHGYSAVLKNALDYAYYEWNNKVAAVVSYSGGSIAGARGVEQLRLVAIELQMAPIREAVHIAGVRQQFDEEGKPKDPMYSLRVERMLDQLVWWAEVLKEGRARAR